MEKTELKTKYGFLTVVTMVIGIVIGSGVFFKAEKILAATGGDLTLGIVAWILGGLVMIVCSFVFSTLAAKYSKVNGLIDYCEAEVSSKYGYFVGWFLANIYYPAMTSVLAWVSARYTFVLFGSTDITGGGCLALACFFLVAIYALNTLAPIAAGKFQISTTIIKLVPLILMGVVGIIAGLFNGILVENFRMVVVSETVKSPLFTAVVATAFAYEGWIIATSINAELKDSKKNLPKALVVGTFIIMVIYILYYIGLAGAVQKVNLMENGEAGAKLAFVNIFSSFAGTLLFVFIIISCLGTTNGLMMGVTRSYYAFAVRGYGPSPKKFSDIEESTNMSANSAIMGVFTSAFWLLYFYGANLTAPWFGVFSFDSSELPIITIYALYIPVFFNIMKKEKDFSTFKRFIMPSLGVIASTFMLIATIYAHGMSVLFYFILFAIIMVVGLLVNKKRD